MSKKIINTIVPILFSMMAYSSSGYAEQIHRTVAKIGQFSVIQQTCDEDANDHCDFVLYEGDDYRLPLVVDWERGLNVENQTEDFLHLSYGYTFNVHHSLFISKAGIVQALDNVVAVDENTGCIARFELKDAPTIIFQKAFTAKILNKIQLQPKQYPNIESVSVDAFQYFSDMEFDGNGGFHYRYKNKNGEDQAVLMIHPCDV
ncbi:hypothetical protein M2R48_16910 [Acinetobacter sp. I-MWF]|nr:hypothetical protein [Acinetobacter sp. I-MWF]